MLDPDRAIAFTHESDGQPPRGGGTPAGSFIGVARSREASNPKLDLKNYSEIFFGLTWLRTRTNRLGMASPSRPHG